MTNPTKLTNTFESVKHTKVNHMTLTSYLEYICDSFLVEKASRYDVKGKIYIYSPYKYYFTDCGLRNALLIFRQTELSHLMEKASYAIPDKWCQTYIKHAVLSPKTQDCMLFYNP